jgi:hypothetical protein
MDYYNRVRKGTDSMRKVRKDMIIDIGNIPSMEAYRIYLPWHCTTPLRLVT